MTTHRRRVAFLGIAVLALIPLATPALAFSPCGSASPAGGLAQLPGGRPLADPIPHIPINGTAGFVVPGATTLPGGDLSLGLGYLGQRSVCQQEEGIFDQNTLFLAIGYGLTERLQLSLQVPYTWYEADKSDFNGSGPDDLSFGLGYRFLDESGWRPALSAIGYAVAPTAQRKEGLGTNEWSGGVALAATKTIVGPLSAFASAGYQYNGRGAAKVEDQFVSGLGLEYVITPHVSLVAEGTANTNWRTEDDRHSDWIAGMDAGVRLRFGDFLISLAGRKGFTNDAPDWGAVRARQLSDERRDAVRREGGGRPGRGWRQAPEAPGAGGPGAGGARAPGAGRRRAPGAPGAGGPGAGGAGAPGAGGAGAGGPGAGGPGAGGAGAPGAGGAGAGGPGAGGAGAGGPGAGGRARSRVCRRRHFRRRSARRSGTSTSSSTSTASPTTRRRPLTSWARRSRRTRSSPSRSKATPTSAGPSSTTSRSASSGPRPPRRTWSRSAWTRAAWTPFPTVSSSRSMPATTSWPGPSTGALTSS